MRRSSWLASGRDPRRLEPGVSLPDALLLRGFAPSETRRHLDQEAHCPTTGSNRRVIQGVPAQALPRSRANFTESCRFQLPSSHGRMLISRPGRSRWRFSRFPSFPTCYPQTPRALCFTNGACLRRRLIREHSRTNASARSATKDCRIVEFALGKMEAPSVLRQAQDALSERSQSKGGFEPEMEVLQTKRENPSC